MTLKSLVDCYSLKKVLLYFGCQGVMFPVQQGCDTREIPICSIDHVGILGQVVSQSSLDRFCSMVVFSGALMVA